MDGIVFFRFSLELLFSQRPFFFHHGIGNPKRVMAGS
jgi:hypothetical protein